jgi:hypothetical protein
MTSRKHDPSGNGSKVLGIVWLLVSAGLAYPAYSVLTSWGFNQALAGVVVFIGACLLYEIPYRARVRAQHELAMKQTDQWRGRSC